MGVALGKFMIALIVKNIPNFTYMENSLPFSQKPATCLCPDTDESSPRRPIVFINSLVILTFLLRLGLKRRLFPSGFLFPYPFLFYSMPCWFDYLNNKSCEQTFTSSKKRPFAHVDRQSKGNYKACSLAQSSIHATLSEWTLLEFNIDSSIVWIHFN